MLALRKVEDRVLTLSQALCGSPPPARPGRKPDSATLMQRPHEISSSDTEVLNLLREEPHLVYPQQKGNSKRPEHLFVEVCHCDEHLVLLIYVYLVQRDLLGTL